MSTGDSRPLTARQQAVFDYIVEYRNQHGYAPTLRDIGKRMGIRSTNGVNDHLSALERKGRLVRANETARGIVPIGADGRAVDLPAMPLAHTGSAPNAGPGDRPLDNELVARFLTTLVSVERRLVTVEEALRQSLGSHAVEAQERHAVPSADETDAAPAETMETLVRRLMAHQLPPNARALLMAFARMVGVDVTAAPTGSDPA